jgi:hypothetical protein
MLVLRHGTHCDRGQERRQMTQPGLWAPARPGTPLVDVIGAGAYGDAPLPDDQPPPASELNWAPGALAGVLSHHTSPRTDTDDAVDQVIAVLEAVRDGRLDRRAVERLYQLLATGAADIAPRTARHVVDHARAEGEPDRQAALAAAVGDVARWLIDTGTDRKAVATGINLAGLLGNAAGRLEAITTLGRHSTFAADSVGVLARLGDDGTETLFSLARQHTGWGRIAAVEALIPAARPDIRRWLLTEGFRNDVSWGYLALLVARNCGLIVMLEQTRDRHLPRTTSDWTAEDNAVLDGARDLLSTMLDPYGPGGDITDYPDAGAAVSIWLELTELRTGGGPGIGDLAFIVELVAALTRDDRLTDENGFGAAQRQSMRDSCDRVLAAPRTAALVSASLATGHPAAMGQISTVAAALGIDPFPPFLPLLRVDPDNSALWYSAARAVGRHTDEFLAAARELLPANGVATNPRACIGPAPGPHMGVTYVLQHAYPRAPGVGWPWLAELLRSPMSGVRWQALTALLSWPRARWPDDATEALRAARAVEDDAKLRDRFDAALD